MKHTHASTLLSYLLTQWRPYSVPFPFQLNCRGKSFLFFKYSRQFPLLVCCNRSQQVFLATKHFISVRHSCINIKNTSKYNLIPKHTSTLKYFGHKWCERFKLEDSLKLRKFQTPTWVQSHQYNLECETPASLRR